jgi:nuclear GTP-binding protein
MAKPFKGSAGKPNALPRSNASSKVSKGRRKDKDRGSSRSAETIARLKMYNNGKAIRNKAGKVVAGSFMMGDRAGYRKITAETGRIAPDRRWFGNTRTVAQTDLDKFREEMTQAVSDPYSVVLKRKKIPMGLLRDAAEYAKSSKTSALLEQEPFEHTFGSQLRRKRVKLDQLLVGRTMESATSKKKKEKATEGTAEKVGLLVASGMHHDDDDDDKADDTAGYEALLSTAQTSQETYQKINTQEGIVPWGRDSNLTKLEGEGVDWRHERKDDLFLKGQSKRIWGEFFKVVDCSDVGELQYVVFTACLSVHLRTLCQPLSGASSIFIRTTELTRKI